jgi:hypothetical protein
MGTIRERSSSMKNRKREICTSGSVRGEGGNLLTYSAGDKWKGNPIATTVYHHHEGYPGKRSAGALPNPQS